MDADAIVAALDLTPHPEGGWYRETWRASAGEGVRAAGTAILFLLRETERSQWHRVDADELWLWQAGSPLLLEIAPGDAGPVETHRLGGHIGAGEVLQAVVPAGAWQAARTEGGWVLVSCVVVPGFEFSGFELAPPSWQPSGRT